MQCRASPKVLHHKILLIAEKKKKKKKKRPITKVFQVGILIKWFTSLLTRWAGVPQNRSHAQLASMRMASFESGLGLLSMADLAMSFTGSAVQGAEPG
jgi:hypothetical protein